MTNVIKAIPNEEKDKCINLNDIRQNAKKYNWLEKTEKENNYVFSKDHVKINIIGLKGLVTVEIQLLSGVYYKMCRSNLRKDEICDLFSCTNYNYNDDVLNKTVLSNNYNLSVQEKIDLFNKNDKNFLKNVKCKDIFINNENGNNKLHKINTEIKTKIKNNLTSNRKKTIADLKKEGTYIFGEEKSGIPSKLNQSEYMPSDKIIMNSLKFSNSSLDTIHTNYKSNYEMKGIKKAILLKEDNLSKEKNNILQEEKVIEKRLKQYNSCDSNIIDKNVEDSREHLPKAEKKYMNLMGKTLSLYDKTKMNLGIIPAELHVYSMCILDKSGEQKEEEHKKQQGEKNKGQEIEKDKVQEEEKYRQQLVGNSSVQGGEVVAHAYEDDFTYQNMKNEENINSKNLQKCNKHKNVVYKKKNIKIRKDQFETFLNNYYDAKKCSYISNNLIIHYSNKFNASSNFNNTYINYRYIGYNTKYHDMHKRLITNKAYDPSEFFDILTLNKRNLNIEKVYCMRVTSGDLFVQKNSSEYVNINCYSNYDENYNHNSSIRISSYRKRCGMNLFRSSSIRNIKDISKDNKNFINGDSIRNKNDNNIISVDNNDNYSIEYLDNYSNRNNMKKVYSELRNNNKSTYQTYNVSNIDAFVVHTRNSTINKYNMMNYKYAKRNIGWNIYDINRPIYEPIFDGNNNVKGDNYRYANKKSRKYNYYNAFRRKHFNKKQDFNPNDYGFTFEKKEKYKYKKNNYKYYKYYYPIKNYNLSYLKFSNINRNNSFGTTLNNNPCGGQSDKCGRNNASFYALHEKKNNEKNSYSNIKNKCTNNSSDNKNERGNKKGSNNSKSNCNNVNSALWNKSNVPGENSLGFFPEDLRFSKTQRGYKTNYGNKLYINKKKGDKWGITEFGAKFGANIRTKVINNLEAEIYNKLSYLKYFKHDPTNSIPRYHCKLKHLLGARNKKKLHTCADSTARDIRTVRINVHVGSVNVHVGSVNVHVGSVNIHAGSVNVHVGNVDVNISNINYYVSLFHILNVRPYYLKL
ncbi:hypothetical protein MKS88_004828 [Plasmodium brasilianum]|uniref:Uncharacterized protein n=1 Tax=Plasmodium brasilianum TaxID=5824 RepID=A0ACB9Y4Y0_PLABR|nr:hypothetical protein MKS88_004828 [Plasmodium brasilianum]